MWNKVDLIDADDRDALGKIAERNDHILTISAITGQGLDELVNRVSTHLTRDIIEDDIHLPYADGRARAWLFEQGVVEVKPKVRMAACFICVGTRNKKRSLKNLLGSLTQRSNCCDPCCGRAGKTGIKRHGNIFPQTPQLSQIIIMTR